MTTAVDSSSGLVFYPAYCYRASSTYNTWAKLTAHDVHNILTKRHGFEGQKTYFYRNHPIKYIRLAGVVVSFSEYDQRWAFVLDDSSGATIEVVGRRPKETEKETATPMNRGEERITDTGADISGVDVGSLLKVKGLIGEWWGMRQVLLERVTVVRDTTEEVKIWEESTRFLIDVLSKPWHLRPEELRKLLAEAEEDKGKDRMMEQRRRERERSLMRREERHCRKIQKQWEREEGERRTEAEACRHESNALFGASTAEAFKKMRYDERVTTSKPEARGPKQRAALTGLKAPEPSLVTTTYHGSVP